MARPDLRQPDCISANYEDGNIVIRDSDYEELEPLRVEYVRPDFGCFETRGYLLVTFVVDFEKAEPK